MGKPTEVAVRAARGVSAAAIQRAIVERAGPTADYGFFTAQQLAANVRTGLSRATHLYDAVLFVCLLVSMLGLGNTLAMSVFERRREVGLLRAIGTARAGIGRMVMAESATLVLVALVLALPLGAAVSSITISSIAGTFGFAPQFVYPWRTVPSLAVLAAAVSLIAAVLPARRAARLDIIDALHLD
jgi:putative ABC transport system permease protein